jgi:Leucine-rich repeat (LRR) protein
VTPERIDFDTADERLEGALSASFQGSYETVLLFAGDAVFDGDLPTDVGVDLIVVTGNLTVNGRIALYDSTPGLFVRGKTTAETLEGGDCEIYIDTGTFKYFVYGYYNDGILETGKVEVPWVINSDHDLRVSSDTAKRIDNFSDNDRYDFTRRRNIGESFVKEVLDKEGEKIDIEAFYAQLAAGKPVLVPGAMTATEAALAEVTAAREAKREELDLSNKKLKAFPGEVLRMPWLKKLVLDGNAIPELPGAIAELGELEELSLVGCGLAALPEELGALGRLRVLRIAGNIKYSWDDEGTSITTPLALPRSVGKLASLEVLDVSGLSAKIDGDEALPDMTSYTLPEELAQAPKLRAIIANQTNVVFPRAMWGMPSVEEISLRGSSWAYLKAYPEGLTSFPNLKKLDIGTNYTRALPELGKLVNLEELVLSDALGLVKEPLVDLSPLRKLRVLKVSGNTGRTNVPEPGHDILRPLFAMDLPALEELRIDRWGEKKGKGIQRDHVPVAMLAGIGRFRSLKKLDLDFDGLAALPDELLALPLEEISLRYNRLPAAERTKLAQAFPKARIDMRKQETDEPREDLGAANELMKAANALRDDEDYDAAIAKYDEALALYEGGRANNEYGLMYAHYGKMWIDGKRGYGKDGSDEQRAAWRKAGVAEAETLLRLVPPVWMIWHFTDEGQFHRECVRYATNFLAWELLQARRDLPRALELIERGAACVDEQSHYYVLDTQVRILLALGRDTDAWRIVKKVLHQDADFAQFQDLKDDARYQAWART